MNTILQSLKDRENVITDLEEKIREFELTTPQSLPETKTDKIRRNQIEDRLSPLDRPGTRSQSVGAKRKKPSLTKSLPATPEPKLKTNPLEGKRNFQQLI